MTIRADHIGGALFILGGLLIFALSGDLPFGSLSFPGAGFMPLIIATLLIIFGLFLALGAAQSSPFSDIDWSDLPHAATVTVIAAATIAFYTVLGFIIVVPAMLFALLVVIERKNILVALLYSAAITTMTWWLFQVLRAPVPDSPLGL